MMRLVQEVEMLMITVRFSPEDLSNVRFAHSPMIELAISYFVLTHPQCRNIHPRWMDETQRAIYGVEFAYLQAIAGSQKFVPDFLTPTPNAIERSIEDEIQKMLQTPDTVVRDNVQTLIECDGDSETRQHFLQYPREMLLCLVEDLRLYWERALQPHWAQMSSIVEGDILYRAKQLAISGTAKVFEEIHPNIRYVDNRLEVRKPNKDWEIDLAGRGMQLVPSIFPTQKLWWQFSPPYTPMLIYDARGVGQWKPEAPKRNESLELLIGAGRASVLIGLSEPATTTELAHRLFMTAGAVSQHLDKLGKAGLVEPRRSGKRVYYHLTKRGDKLLALFDGQIR
jgi:DNA-binding transcriptional ArsR family regulator